MEFIVNTNGTSLSMRHLFDVSDHSNRELIAIGVVVAFEKLQHNSTTVHAKLSVFFTWRCHWTFFNSVALRFPHAA